MNITPWSFAKILALVVLLAISVSSTPVQNNSEKIYRSIALGYGWFTRNTSPETGLLPYIYYPQEDAYSKENNTIRQLVAIWTITKTQEFLKTNQLDSLVRKSLDYYLRDDKEKSIAKPALLVLILLDTHYPKKGALIAESAEGVLAQQNPDGSLRMEQGSALVEYPKAGIASGEAMLALIRLYEVTRDKKYLMFVERAFSFYRDYWRKQGYFFVHWQTQAYYLLYRETQNPEVAKFIFEMNDWVMNTGLPQQPPSVNTATIAEGIADAYQLTRAVGDKKRERKYRVWIKKNISSIISLQVDENEARGYKNPVRALGGFFFSPKERFQMIDSTFHSLSALMKIYAIEEERQ